MNINNHSTYEGQQFNNFDACEVTLLQSEFLGCEFQHCSFGESVFNACTFRDCVLKTCNLDLIQIDKSVFKNCQFEDCKMMGINWTRASWGRREMAQLIKTINFQGCVLNYSTFMGLNLNGMKIIDCVALEVDFSEALLRKADFSGTDLQRAIFRNTDLRAADFSKARNYFISPQLNTISQAKFSLPEAMALLSAMDIILEEQED